MIEEPAAISVHIYSYKELFSAEPSSGAMLSPNCWFRDEQVSNLDNTALTLPFLEDEIHKAVRDMKASPAPGPNGLPVLFLKTF